MGIFGGEEVTMDDLVERDGRRFYRKFRWVPFDGEVTGSEQGNILSGYRHGPWVSYHKDGTLDETTSQEPSRTM